MKTNIILQGDALERLQEIPSESLDLIVTSPPYFSLRSYLPEEHPDKKKEIGAEKTFADYQKNILSVTKELFRVLKKEGSFWLNLGDSYASKGNENSKFSPAGNISIKESGRARTQEFREKSLIGAPWRIALAMQDEQNWILRQEVRWVKQVLIWGDKKKQTIGSVMPSSVTDRFNAASECFFHFVKQPKYYFNLNAVKIPMQVLGITDFRAPGFVRSAELGYHSKYAAQNYSPQSKQSNVSKKTKQDLTGNPTYTGFNKRWKQRKVEETASFFRKKGSGGNVNLLTYSSDNLLKNIPNNWLVPFEFLKEAHFAAFPTALCEIPILSSCPAKGIVLDPFFGSGTVGIVALELDRQFLGIELSSSYIDIAMRRIVPNLPKNKLF